MALRPTTSRKENVPPRPATPLKPEQWRLPKSLGVDLGSGHKQWVPTCQAKKEGPAATLSPGPTLSLEPWRVQTNLASPRPSPALKDWTDQLANTSSQQQSNVQPQAQRPLGGTREPAVRQSNLGTREAGWAWCGGPAGPHLWSEPQDIRPHLKPWESPLRRGPTSCCPSTLGLSQLLAADTPCLGFRPPAGSAPLAGHTQPGPRSRCGLGEPLTLDDLAVRAPSQGPAPAQVAVHQLWVSVQRLELQVARLWRRESQGPPEPPNSVKQGPWASDGQVHSTHHLPCPPVLASWDKRKKCFRGHGETGGSPGSREGQAGCSDSKASSKSTSPETAGELLTWGCLDPEPGVPTAHSLQRAESRSPGPACVRGQRRDSWLPAGDRAQCFESLEAEVARCFRAWWHLVRKRQAAVLSHRQQSCRGPGALRLREAQLEVAWTRHTQTLLAQSFQKWRDMTQQQRSEQTCTQEGLGPQSSGAGRGQISLGRKAAVHLTWRGSTGNLQEEAGVQRLPSRPRLRPGGGARRAETLHALRQLAVFLLWCRQKERAQQEQRGQGETPPASRRTQCRGRAPQASCPPAADTASAAPLATQPQRAWLSRCFGAWQRLVQRGFRFRRHLTARRAGALRSSLRQWARMTQLRASDGVKVAQLSLCWQKAGHQGLRSPVRGAALACDLGTVAPAGAWPQEPGRGLLQAACRRLALRRALLLWTTRLSQRQQADSFLQGLCRRTLRGILRGWHSRAWGPGTVPGSTRTTSALESLHGCSTPQSLLEKASTAPALLDTLRVNFLWAAGRRQQGQCLLLWQARARQSRGAARWHQHGLQRRIILGWSHWVTAHRARRALAARWAWGRSCRAVLGVWRQRLAQRRELERWAWARGWRLVRDALGHWRACWQRQRSLRDRQRSWVRGRLRALLWGWRQAAAHRRDAASRPELLLLHSCLQAWRGVLRDRAERRAGRGAFHDPLRRRAPSAACQGAPAAQAALARWRGLVRGRRADQQLRRTRARRAFLAWQVALGRQRVQEQARARAPATLRWTLWVRESHLRSLSRARAARRLSARVLAAWAQSAARGRVLHAAAAQVQRAGLGRLLQTHWAQWRAALLTVRLGRGAEVQGASAAHLRHWPRLASRGHQLALMDTPAPRKQTPGCGPPAPTWLLPGPAWQPSLHGQREWRDTCWVQSMGPCRWPARRWPPLQLPWPTCNHWAQGWTPTGPGGGCALRGGGEAHSSQLGRKYLRRWRLEALLRRFRGAQRARRLARTWQCWVDAQGAEQLARALGGPGLGLPEVQAPEATAPLEAPQRPQLGQGLRRAWRVWRRRVVQLQVARRVQRQEDGWLLAQAFGKWHQSLAARARGVGATSSGRPRRTGPGSTLDTGPGCSHNWSPSLRAQQHRTRLPIRKRHAHAPEPPRRPSALGCSPQAPRPRQPPSERSGQ